MKLAADLTRDEGVRLFPARKLPRWLRRCSFVRPSNIDARTVDGARNIVITCYLIPRHSARTKRYISPIACLLGGGNPTAVRCAIARVIVNPLNSQPASIACGSGPLGKTFVGQPFITNRNSARAIIFELWTFLVRASFFHGFPDAVKSRSCFPVGADACAI